MKPSIVIVNWNTKELTAGALQSIDETQRPRPEVIVVDNGSTDGSVAFLKKEFPWVKLLELPENRGFTGGNNAGLSEVNGDVTLLLNSDTVLLTDLAPLLEEFSDPSVGAVGPKVLNADRSVQRAARDAFPSTRSSLRENPYLERLLGPTPLDDQGTRRPVAWVSGAALLVRTDLLRRLGGFDEDFFMYFEETDLCKRITDEGYRVIFNPQVELIHLHGGSSEAGDRESLAPAQFYRSQLRYLAKHRVAGRSLVRASLLLGSLLLWPLMKLRGRPRLAERYRLILRSCLSR